MTISAFTILLDITFKKISAFKPGIFSKDMNVVTEPKTSEDRLLLQSYDPY